MVACTTPPVLDGQTAPQTTESFAPQQMLHQLGTKVSSSLASMAVAAEVAEGLEVGADLEAAAEGLEVGAAVADCRQAPPFITSSSQCRQHAVQQMKRLRKLQAPGSKGQTAGS